MEKVELMLNNGKSRKVKRKLADVLVKRGKGEIVEVPPEPEFNASNAVKLEAQARGIDLGHVIGTGKDGRILKRDLNTYQTRMLQAE